jgi:hypothetical protein
LRNDCQYGTVGSDDFPKSKYYQHGHTYGSGTTAVDLWVYFKRAYLLVLRDHSRVDGHGKAEAAMCVKTPDR